WKKKRQGGGAGAPEPCAQIGNVDADLDRERPWQRLTNSNGLTHLFVAQPFAVRDKLALHLSNQGDWAAKSEQAKTQEIHHQLAETPSIVCGRPCHGRLLLGNSRARSGVRRLKVSHLMTGSARLCRPARFVLSRTSRRAA